MRTVVTQESDAEQDRCRKIEIKEKTFSNIRKQLPENLKIPPP